MSRKTTTVTIAMDQESNRDRGKTYLLTEMSATDAERWAARALLGMGRTGLEVPPEFMDAGMAGLAAVGIRALGTMAFHDAEPLMAEMMACVQFVPDSSRPDVVRSLVETDTEEVATRLRLRSEVIELHLGFSIADALRKLGASAKRAAIDHGSNMSMSAEPSGLSSAPASPVS